jgi:uncharacterized lipoprotein YehR (DUF1307 family)
MKIKRSLTVIMALVLAFALVACSSGPDVTELNESYNALSGVYNDMIAVATENGWDQDADIVAKLNEIVQNTEKVAGVINDPDDYSQEQIDELKTTCDELYAWVGDMQAVVSEPYSD